MTAYSKLVYPMVNFDQSLFSLTRQNDMDGV